MVSPVKVVESVVLHAKQDYNSVSECMRHDSHAGDDIRTPNWEIPKLKARASCMNAASTWFLYEATNRTFGQHHPRMKIEQATTTPMTELV